MSDIFKNYVKILQENNKKAKIALASHAEHTETSFHETNPRMDSLSIEQISKLYNTKPSLPKDMEYEHNIMEDAHPESLVISPAHDKLNGLIENENEGQAIRIRIVNKIPNGFSTQHKYAKKEFVHSLVNIANELDKQNNTALLALADVCLLQAAEKPIEKTAFWPVALVIAGIPAIIWAQQHLQFHSDGFDQDYQKVIKEINDIVDSDSNPIFVGYSYDPRFIQMMGALSTELTKLYAAYHKLLPILDEVETPHEQSELDQIAKQPKTQQAAQALTEFHAVLNQVKPFMDKIIANLHNENYKKRAIQQKGWLSQIADYTQVLHGGYGLISDDFDDVKRALETLNQDITDIETELVKGQQAAISGQKKSPTPVATEEPGSKLDPLEMLKKYTPSQLQSLVDELTSGKIKL